MSLLLLGFKIALGTVANLEKTETYTLQAKITNELYCGRRAKRGDHSLF